MCEFSLSANAKLGKSRFSFCPSLPAAVIPRLLQLTGRGRHLDRGQSSGLDRLCYHHTLTKPFISFGRAWQHWEDDSQWTITLKAGLLFPSGLPISSAHKLISASLCSITDINPEGGVFIYTPLVGIKCVWYFRLSKSLSGWREKWHLWHKCRAWFMMLTLTDDKRQGGEQTLGPSAQLIMTYGIMSPRWL